jgi:hypothetical protein
MSADHPIYCTAQTFRATREEPSEYCENEVDDHGDLCADHDEEDRAAAAYEAWREDSRYDD